MEIGDIVILKEDSFLKEYFPGYCEIIGTKTIMRELRYNIKTIDFINGSQNITLSYENDIIPIVRIRNEKLNKLLDEI
jgi:hypothetical protein